MSKKIYISPETVRIHLEASFLILADSQSNVADAKQHGFPIEEEAAHPEDLWK